MKKLMILFMVVMTTLGLSAQTMKEVTIQTNGKCGRCARTMQTAVPTFEGVESCSYDMATAKITVKYDAKKTNEKAIRTGISNLGYDADKVKANADARAKLPACCRGEAKCGSAKEGDHKCAGEAKSGEHKCAGEAKSGEHKCAGEAKSGEHKCAGEHK